ncbi:hypothetical protein PENSPDRAFT_587391 [Peniophora sp. CONT]|nr:hypothetical protein PENSPDRAFT_587391 [Peniophora sp. CONT]
MQSLVPQNAHPAGVFLVRDGFLAHMFGSRVEIFYQSLLKTSIRSLSVQYPLHGWPWAFALSAGAVAVLQANVTDAHQVPYLLLDFLANPTIGPVVPQKLWLPRSSRDISRYVLEAALGLPIFFVQNDGRIGFTVAEASAGNLSSLLGCVRAVSVGGVTSVSVRIQWPGYKDWRRQFPTRDATAERNVITLEQFVRQVGRTLDSFLLVCLLSYAIWRKDIIIIGAVHVSTGSWMPILQLNCALPV